ncbi:MBL fold metallo-hydrolase [Paenibacillus gansuensis]|uniref:MBL fold metallo-hydrolase n=1 Tax=Paenibacillus gansuensis TaxID=306542 RepID=A0ABW5PB72_9BACL
MAVITFLGTGDSMGVPRVYCRCQVCNEARLEGVNRRLRSSIWIDFSESETPDPLQTFLAEAREASETELLLDCGPDWASQMEAIGIRQLHRVLLTHAHHDHIGGLPEWADACRWLGVRGTVYAPEEVNKACIERYPWIANHLEFLAIDQGITLHGWEIAPWKVSHGKNGYSFAYQFAAGDRSWVYCSDAIHLNDDEKAPMNDVDMLILGTSFYREPYEMSTRSVYDIVEGIGVVKETRAARAVFTHMSHDVDVRNTYDLPGHISLARTGRKIIV